MILNRISTEIKKVNERYPHFDVVITSDYMSRPVAVVNKINFLGGGLILEGVLY